MLYALSVFGFGSITAMLLAATDSAPPWSYPAVVTAMGGALVYAYRNSESRANKSEVEKYDLGLKVTDALRESSLVLARVLDVLTEEDPPSRSRRQTR